jgi:hypothetical protein
MVTIKIELNEEYINEQSKMENIIKGENTSKALAQMVAFKHIKECVDKGQKEFSIKRDFDNENVTESFDGSVLSVLLILALNDSKTKKKEPCQSNE